MELRAIFSIGRVVNLFPCPGGAVKQACVFGSLAVDLNQAKLPTKLSGKMEPEACSVDTQATSWALSLSASYKIRPELTS